MSTYKDYIKAQSNYLELLADLKAFVTSTRDHVSEEKLNLGTLLEYVDLMQEQNLPINNTIKIGDQAQAVNLVTAHGAKGLEFKHVFVLFCNQEIWNNTSRASKLPPPINLNIAPPADNDDDKLRLFYVAITRARQFLYLTRSALSINDKELTPLAVIDDKIEFEKIPTKIINIPNFKPESRIITHHFSPIKISYKIDLPEKAFMEPILSNYKLSVTHLNNFITITGTNEHDRGGPKKFLETNFLRFPTAKQKTASYGSAMHEAVRRFIQTCSGLNQNLKLEKLLEMYEDSLQIQNLNPIDYQEYLRIGKKYLANYYEHELTDFDYACHLEFDFNHHNIHIKDARITGKIDKIHTDKVSSSLIVTDFKTGKISTNWNGGSEFEKIKLRNYRRQLIFYKLLIDNSNYFQDSHSNPYIGQLEYFESPNQIQKLQLKLTNEDATELTKLINAVWTKIINLEFPDTSHYDNSLVGMEMFIDDLINERI